MTKEELLAALYAATLLDQKEGHIASDDALIEYIDDEDVAKAYYSDPKWYA